MSCGPINAGHTLSNLRNGKHYRNLTAASKKIGAIKNKIEEVKTSLSTASGTEIDKVLKDLNDVKAAFRSVEESITARIDELETRAVEYDEIYDALAKKCANKTVLTNKEEYVNESYAYMALLDNKSRTKRTTKVTADSVKWDQYDGTIIFTVKYTCTDVQEETGVHFALSEDNYKEVGDKKVSSYTTDYRVGQYGDLTAITYITSGK